MTNIYNPNISFKDIFRFLPKSGFKNFLTTIFIIPLVTAIFGIIMLVPLNDPRGDIMTCIVRGSPNFKCMLDYSLIFKYFYITLLPGITLFKIFPRVISFFTGTFFPFLAITATSMFFYQTVGRVIDWRIKKSKEKEIKVL